MPEEHVQAFEVRVLVGYHLAQGTVEIAERLHLAAPELPEAAKNAVNHIRTWLHGEWDCLGAG